MKASKPVAKTYTLVISQLDIEPDLTSPPFSSLTEVVKLARRSFR